MEKSFSLKFEKKKLIFSKNFKKKFEKMKFNDINFKYKAKDPRKYLTSTHSLSAIYSGSSSRVKIIK